MSIASVLYCMPTLYIYTILAALLYAFPTTRPVSAIAIVAGVGSSVWIVGECIDAGEFSIMVAAVVNFYAIVIGVPLVVMAALICHLIYFFTQGGRYRDNVANGDEDVE